MKYENILSIAALLAVLFVGSSILISAGTDSYNKYTETQLEVRKWLHKISQPPKPDMVCEDCKVIRDSVFYNGMDSEQIDTIFKRNQILSTPHYEEGANIMPEEVE